MKQTFKNKIILVTGGLGSIGSEIVKQCLKLNPKQIRIYDNRETESFNMEQKMQDKRLRFLIGDIRDKDRLNMAMENVNIVFHASALKHVSLSEHNPFEAVKTNVIGTQNLIEVALRNKVEKVINISTDKAVNPTSVMGATKLLTEKLITTAHNYQGNKKTLFSSVRFGNVLGSRGSVTQIFKKQITAGKPLTLTDSDAVRFAMSIKQAVKLILKSTESMTGNELFVLKMPLFKVKDLAEVMIDELSPEKAVEIKVIGLRTGEKLKERLLTKDELRSFLKKENIEGLMKK